MSAAPTAGLPALRPAWPEEAPALSDLALRSKGHWGYDADFLAACRAELTLDPHLLAAHRTLVAEVDGRLAGFGTVEGVPPYGELGMLFVEPDLLGRGIGGVLLAALVERARTEGFTRLSIDADPHAEAFYLARGAVRTGSIPSSSIPGRTLPRLELDLSAG